MKKVGYFFACFLPLIITIAVQFLAIAFMSGIYFLYSLFSGKAGSGDLLTTYYDLLTNTEFNACIMIIYALTCAIVFGLWYYSRCGGNFLPNPSRTFSVSQIAGVVLLIPGLQFFSGFLTQMTAAIVPKWMEQYENLMEQSGLDSEVGILMLIYGVIIGPICEELAFRGVTLRFAQQALPFWLANLFQAVLFGIFHMNWIQGIYAFSLGIVLGLICHYGQSIYYSILLHILFNFWGLVLGEILFGNMEETVLSSLILLGLMLVSLAAGTTLFVLGTRNKAKRSHASTFSAEGE